MTSIRTRDIILLFAVLVIFVNLMYFKYVQSSLNNKIEAAKNKLSQTESSIIDEITIYSQNLKVFNDLTFVKKEIVKSENKIQLLQSKINSEVQISQVIKALIQKNGTIVNNIRLKNSKVDGFKHIFYFEVEVEGNTKNLMGLISKMEDNNDFIKIDKYVWNKKDNIVNLKMDISTVFVELK